MFRQGNRAGKAKQKATKKSLAAFMEDAEEEKKMQVPVQVLAVGCMNPESRAQLAALQRAYQLDLGEQIIHLDGVHIFTQLVASNGMLELTEARRKSPGDASLASHAIPLLAGGREGPLELNRDTALLLNDVDVGSAQQLLRQRHAEATRPWVLVVNAEAARIDDALRLRGPLLCPAACVLFSSERNVLDTDLGALRFLHPDTPVSAWWGNRLVGLAWSANGAQPCLIPPDGRGLPLRAVPDFDELVVTGRSLVDQLPLTEETKDAEALLDALVRPFLVRATFILRSPRQLSILLGEMLLQLSAPTAVLGPDVMETNLRQLIEVPEDDLVARRNAVEAVLQSGWELGQRLRDQKTRKALKRSAVDLWFLQFRLPSLQAGRTPAQMARALANAPKTTPDHLRRTATTYRSQQKSQSTPSLLMLQQVCPDPRTQAIVVQRSGGSVTLARRMAMADAITERALIPDNPWATMALCQASFAVVPLMRAALFGASLIGVNPRTDRALEPLRMFAHQLVTTMPGETLPDRTQKAMEFTLDVAERILEQHLPVAARMTLTALLFVLDLAVSEVPLIPNFVTLLSDPRPLKGKRAAAGYRILARAFRLGLLGPAFASQLVIMFMHMLNAVQTTHEVEQARQRAERRRQEQEAERLTAEQALLNLSPGDWVIRNLEMLLEDDDVEVLETHPAFVFRLTIANVSRLDALAHSCMPTNRYEGYPAYLQYDAYAEEPETAPVQNFRHIGDGRFERNQPTLAERFVQCGLPKFMNYEAKVDGKVHTLTALPKPDIAPDAADALAMLAPYTLEDAQRDRLLHSRALAMLLEEPGADDLAAAIEMARAELGLCAEEKEEEYEEEEEEEEVKAETKEPEAPAESAPEVLAPALAELESLPFRVRLQKLNEVLGFPITELWSAANLKEKQLVALTKLFCASVTGEEDVEPASLMDLARLADPASGYAQCNIAAECDVLVPQGNIVPCSTCTFTACVECCEHMIGSGMAGRGVRLSSQCAPCPQCNSPLPEGFLKRVLTEKKLLDPLSRLPQGYDFFFCSKGDECKHPQGTNAIHPLPPEDPEDRAQCAAAGEEDEKGDAFAGLNCPACEDYLAAQRNDEEFRQFIRDCRRNGVRVRRSPCCGRPAMLRDACFHITCPQCVSRRDKLSHWCWHCGKGYRTGGEVYAELRRVVREQKEQGNAAASIHNVPLIPNEEAATQGMENLSNVPEVEPRRAVGAGTKLLRALTWLIW